MISASDFVCLPYTPDLTESGIGYACRSLPHTYDRMGGSSFDRLRRIVVGLAVELAFRRHLAQQNIPFDVRGATPFTDPDRYDVSLGGHRCDIKSFLISYREQIGSVQADSRVLLDAPALVPLDQYAAGEHTGSELYLFAFLTGLLAPSPADVQRAMAADRPVHMLYPMPAAWVRPQVWTPLGPLALKSESNRSLAAEIGGQDANRDFITCNVELEPRQRTEIDAGFYSLAYIHCTTPPDKRLGVHARAMRETLLIAPSDWGNVWVYGMRIYLTGWIPRQEFRQKAALVQPGSHVFQYDRTRTRNLAVPISQLRPLPELFDRVRSWPRS